ncbi:lipoyl domain-containing protein [Polaribacter sargassicola]|uniref:lipoyl domain-containing protein n=1 Tax=Polaribacter sargassicola TaxID=2836891 RepID=UPI001F164FA3|nr:lipoyl domain-containing protein [Polaribacter sp. DS7-9]MCG1036850.1 lipoyl domain-containing protein [Polaribacter sp. DS7-9]
MGKLTNFFDAIFKSKLTNKEVNNTITKIDYIPSNIEIIKMPNINNKQFKVSKWFCKVGNTVKKGDIICELDSKGNTIEFESFISGKLVEITTKKGFLNYKEEICKIERF